MKNVKGKCETGTGLMREMTDFSFVVMVPGDEFDE